jgi:predicted MFS family arabinose efflux permease
MILLIDLYQVGLYEKTALGSISSCGLLIGLPLFRFISKWRQPASNIIAFLLLLSVVFLGLSLTVQHVWWFIICISLCIIIPISGLPFLSEIYSSYKKNKRGKRYVTSLLAGNIGVLLFTYLGTQLYGESQNSTALITLFTACLLIAAICSYKTPVEFQKRLTPSFRDFAKVLTQDKLFSYICLAWFVLGAGNLWLYPYRTNYLMEASFGHELSAKETLFLVVVMPEAIRMATAPIYAFAFDRYNFVILRMLINIFFVFYCFIFFSSTSYIGVFAGSCFQGLAMGGGSIAWQLWVTRLAPTGQSSTYMAIHTFLTGIRKILCPVLGLWALQDIGPNTCAWISAGMILFSTVMLIPVISYGKTRFEN